MADKCPECDEELGFQKHTLELLFCSEKCKEKFLRKLRLT